MPYPISHFLSYDKFSYSDWALLVAITLHDQPKSFSHAASQPQWHDAMAKEWQVLEDNQT